MDDGHTSGGRGTGRTGGASGGGTHHDGGSGVGTGSDFTAPAVGGPTGAALLSERLAERGVAMVSLHLPPDLDRATAARRIAEEFARLVQTVPRPGTLIVAGGETLKALCLALGARCLEAAGQVSPGVPRSAMRGGAWDGLDVVSKSGAFGADTLWRDLLARNGLPTGRIEA